MIKGICQTLEDSFPNDEGLKTRRPSKDRAMGYGRESMEKAVKAMEDAKDAPNKVIPIRKTK
jgi:hypothetical protein